jgi:hypothetical protein
MGVLDAVDRLALASACRMLARSEKSKDPTAAVRLANCGFRALASIRRAKRRTGSIRDRAVRDSTFDTHMASLKAKPGTAAVEGEDGTP